MHARRLVVASALTVVVTAAFLPGSGFGSSAAARSVGQMKIPAGLAAALHARFGARAIRSGASAQALSLDTDLGLSVALSADGTTALVGAPGVAGSKGAAYIFHTADAGAWTSSKVPTATLTSKASSRGVFGLSVALSADGTTAFVGAPFTGGGLFSPGAIYVFHASSEDAWASSSKPAATLTAGGGVWVGVSLALSPDGTTLVAGAPFYSTLGGGAYVFHVAGEGAWATTSTPAAVLSYGAESPDDGGAGFSVAISADGTTALVSDSGNTTNGGGAWVYHVASASSWASSSTPTAILSDSGRGAHDTLGSVLSLSTDGTVALLGASAANASTGVADVFRSSGEAAWVTTSTPTATLTNATGFPGDAFGENVTISNDGTTALVFAPEVNAERGAAYVFHVASEGAWASSAAPTATLTNAAGRAKDLLGVGALSTDGATALVGAPGVRQKTGAAYVFHAAGESSWTSTSAPMATLTNDKLAACVVPKLKGMKLNAARTALAVGRCRLGKVGKVRSRSHARRKRGRVLSQNRKPGRRLAIGAKIGVKVGK